MQIRTHKLSFDVKARFTPNLQPDLSGNPFLWMEKQRQKRLGTEGGNSCPSKKVREINDIILCQC